MMWQATRPLSLLAALFIVAEGALPVLALPVFALPVFGLPVFGLPVFAPPLAPLWRPRVGVFPAAGCDGKPVEIVPDELLGRGAHALIIPLLAALVEPARARSAQVTCWACKMQGRRPRRTGTASLRCGELLVLG